MGTELSELNELEHMDRVKISAFPTLGGGGLVSFAYWKSRLGGCSMYAVWRALAWMCFDRLFWISWVLMVGACSFM